MVHGVNEVHEVFVVHEVYVVHEVDDVIEVNDIVIRHGIIVSSSARRDDGSSKVRSLASRCASSLLQVCPNCPKGNGRV